MCTGHIDINISLNLTLTLTLTIELLCHVTSVLSPLANPGYTSQAPRV